MENLSPQAVEVFNLRNRNLERLKQAENIKQSSSNLPSREPSRGSKGSDKEFSNF
jgi:hypothetical protein